MTLTYDIDSIGVDPSRYLAEATPSSLNNFTDAVGASVIGNSQTGNQLSNVGRDNPLIVVDTTDSLQDAITKLNIIGGGRISLLAGTYTIKTAITAYSSITIEGISPSATILDFASTSANLSFSGTGVYSTGTITSISGGVTVTGSGTSWLANASAGQHIFIGTRWYQIAAVTANDTIILAEGYGDDVTMPGATYRIASIQQNIILKNLTVKGSTGTGLIFTDCRRITIDNVLTQSNNKGAVFTNCSEINNERFLAVTNTSNGIELTNVGLSDWESVLAISNGGHGFVLNNVKTMSLVPCLASGNTSDGWNVTSGVNLVGTFDATSNGGQGIECVATCDNIAISNAIIKSNTSDGIKLTATSDNIRIFGSNIQNNGGYGVNIAASSCDNAVITTNVFASNTSGAITNSGTATVIRGNVGATDNTTAGVFGGTGADGALSISSGTTTLDFNSANVLTKNYTSISITGTAILTTSNPNTNGSILVLKSQGDVTISATVDVSSMGGSAGSGGAPSSQPGTSGSTGSGNIASAPAGQANATSTLGGTAGTSPVIFAFVAGKVIQLVTGGGGAGGGTGTNASASGGSGGRGGGAIYIECGGALNISGTLTVAGGSGAQASAPGAGNSGSGGGGGGGGGTIVALYKTLTANTATLTVAGGSGGAARVGTGGTGGGGGGGGAGATTSGSNGSDGSGSNGGAGGNGGNGSSLVTANVDFS